jgi:hypothetical protein
MANWHNWDESLYASNFRRRADWLKRRKKYTCEHCGAKQGEERMNKYGCIYKVKIAAAHVNHDPRNPRAKLMILCSACHAKYDAMQHGKQVKRTYHRKQREAQIQAGQLELSFKRGRR